MDGDSYKMKKLVLITLIWQIFLGSVSVYAEDDLPMVGVTPPPPPPSELPDEGVTIKADATLTDNIKNNSGKEDDAVIPMPSISETLSDKIADIEKEGSKQIKSAGETLSDMIRSKKSEPAAAAAATSGLAAIHRSNAAVFDISGAMLRMSPAQIDTALTGKGYKKTMQKLDIPNFIRWRNEEKCRAQGVVGYERLESCVAQMAKKDNHQFIERVFYAKYDTQEDMEIRFTSNFTQNKAYYITYKTSVLTNLRGNSQKEFYLRKIKIYDFWKRINQKYGVPDNKENIIWGLGGNKPYLQAGTGRLRLEDTALRDLDYARMSREDRKFMNTGVYNF